MDNNLKHILQHDCTTPSEMWEAAKKYYKTSGRVGRIAKGAVIASVDNPLVKQALKAADTVNEMWSAYASQSNIHKQLNPEEKTKLITKIESFIRITRPEPFII